MDIVLRLCAGFDNFSQWICHNIFTNYATDALDGTYRYHIMASNT